MSLCTSDPAFPRQLLDRMARAAIDAALPAQCLPPVLAGIAPPPPGRGRTLVIGAGKAAAAMAQTVEEHWPVPLSGLVVTRYGHGTPCRQIEVIEAAHPVPDQAGQAAARRMLQMVQGLTADDLVLCLISGGGSSLLALPAEGISLADKQQVNRALLRSGAAIDEMNCVRKHLSAIKGGRLAAACAPARLVTLMISDVPGDDPSVIASGPTVADPTTFSDALAVLKKYGIHEPRSVIAHLQAARDETPKPGDARLAASQVHIIATAQHALLAAAKVAEDAGVRPLILSDNIEGESREIARMHAAIAYQISRYDQPAAAPCVIISGGETTVTVRGKGRGGRNAEFMLALAVALDGHPSVHAIAIDTDGIDGSEDNAGAWLIPDSIGRAARKGIDAKACLANNDGYSFFQAAGSLVVTGPTLTNVNDFRAILIL